MMKQRKQFNLSLKKMPKKRKREGNEYRTKDVKLVSIGTGSSSVAPCDGDSSEKPRNILSWLKHPSNPCKTTACPACERAVRMSDINRHLDSDCDLYVVINTSDSNTKGQRCSAESSECLNQSDAERTSPVDENSSVAECGSFQETCSETDSKEVVGANPESLSNVEDPDSTSRAINYPEPYYLANFKFVLKSVLSSQDDAKLFNSDDMHFINAFNNLSAEGQKLYIRLFQRKSGWFRCCKLDYQEISQDLKPVIGLLKEKGFLEGERNLTELPDILDLIPAPELKNLAKELHISLKPPHGKKGTTKEALVGALIHHSEKQRSLFGKSVSVILKRAKQILGSCVKVSKESKAVFSRVILLFTMNMIPDDEDQAQAQQLSTLYLVNSAKVVYPTYTICRVTPVFRTRDELLRFSAASQDKHEMFTALENKDFDTAIQYYPAAAEAFERVLSDLDKTSSGETNATLPVHLRCFTAEYVLCKMCYLGVEILQKQRQYEQAVNQLELLLKQDVFCRESRGKWFDRLALNLHQHLKEPIKALEVIRQGLTDPSVRAGRRLALIQRAKRILSSPTYQKKRKAELDDFEDMVLVEPEAPKCVTISGTRSAQLGVFISNDADTAEANSDCTKTFCSVEEFALAHYRQQGYRQGIHGEGSTFTTLFGLLMWDVIFADGIPDVFRGPFQSAPLDILSDSFYETRKVLFEKRLKEIQSSSVEQLQELLAKSWCLHEGQICIGVSWDRFTGIDQAKELVSCLGGKFLAGVFQIFAQGYRYRCSGIPDLVVWNSSTLEYKIVEVKGPGDRLSTKQQIWLEELSALGAQTEVCHVTAVGAKRLKVA